MVAVYNVPMAREGIICASNASLTLAMSTSTTAICAIFAAPKTGNINRVGAYISAVTGTAPTYRWSIQGVQDTNEPDGTIEASGAAYVDSSTYSVGCGTFTLGTSAAVTAGQLYAVVCEYQSGTVDASNDITISYGVTSGAGGASVVKLPYAATTTDSWTTVTASQRIPAMFAQYDSSDADSIVPFMAATDGWAAMVSGWNSAGDPLYKGTKWTPPFGCTAIGLITGMRQPLLFDYDIHVFDGATSLRGVSYQSPHSSASTGGAFPQAHYFAPLALTADTAYRFVVEPTTTTAPTTCYRWDMDSVEAVQALVGDLYACESPSTVAWTDYDNGADGYKVHPMIPIISDITVSTGGGGTTVAQGIQSIQDGIQA